MMLTVEKCPACGMTHMNVETSSDEVGEHYLCSRGREGVIPFRVNVLMHNGSGFFAFSCAGDVKSTTMNASQPPPRPGNAPATWNLVMTDMLERDRVGAAKYGVRHQFDNGRDHLVDAYQEQLDNLCYTRAEIEKRKRMRELARLLRGPENSSQLAELLNLVEGRQC